jgi:hypothetical protein
VACLECRYELGANLTPLLSAQDPVQARQYRPDGPGRDGKGFSGAGKHDIHACRSGTPRGACMTAVCVRLLVFELGMSCFRQIIGCEQ